MLLTNSSDELLDIPPIPYEDKVLKMPSLYHQVAPQNTHSMSETAVLEPKINEPCIVMWE